MKMAESEKIVLVSCIIDFENVEVWLRLFCLNFNACKIMKAFLIFSDQILICWMIEPSFNKSIPFRAPQDDGDLCHAVRSQLDSNKAIQLESPESSPPSRDPPANSRLARTRCIVLMQTRNDYSRSYPPPPQTQQDGGDMPGHAGRSGWGRPTWIARVRSSIAETSRQQQIYSTHCILHCSTARMRRTIIQQVNPHHHHHLRMTAIIWKFSGLQCEEMRTNSRDG